MFELFETFIKQNTITQWNLSTALASATVFFSFPRLGQNAYKFCLQAAYNVLENGNDDRNAQDQAVVKYWKGHITPHNARVILKSYWGPGASWLAQQLLHKLKQSLRSPDNFRAKLNCTMGAHNNYKYNDNYQ